MWFLDDPSHVRLFQQAGRNASITQLSEWVCAWPEEELDNLVRDFPDIRDDWDATYGDTINQLVFIGKGYEKAEIVRRLHAVHGVNWVEKKSIVGERRKHRLGGESVLSGLLLWSYALCAETDLSVRIRWRLSAVAEQHELQA